jgi:protein-S-isoprenylcysteine O-methyltransferase Ste14
VFLLAYFSKRFYFPFYLQVTSGILILPSLILLIKTLLFESDFSGKSTELKTTGSYNISRHPGVLYFILTTLFLALFTRSTSLIYSMIIFSILDIIIVIFEDSIFLPRKFINYNEYKKQTPFLIPRVIKPKSVILKKRIKDNSTLK